ncbi:MAG: hypothetical protein EHM70_16060 [Chloroflexota bacterium]|nr:MAG: hypothetical protein EHM70_16060 [Chloroflexota bacterium]
MLIDERVEELLQQLTLREKISLLSGKDAWHTVEIERLGIPSLTMSDGPHGVRANNPEAGRMAGPTTAFPTGVVMASSWDTRLVERVAAALAEETRAMGCDLLLGPCVNIVRHPLAGRNFESYSEDPYLAGRIGIAWVNGLQGKKVGASLKHYACNNQEIERSRGNSEVDERTLREIYLAQFEAIVKETQPWTVMCSYNRINGLYASEHDYLLNEILKNEWGFEGVVVSDWGANHTIVESVRGGLDLEMPGPAKYYGSLLLEAVTNWQIEEEAIDEAARRMLRMVLRSGKMDAEPLPAGSVNTPEHRQVARELAEEAITLLKNERGLLPIDVNKVDTLAIIGPNASDLVVSGGGSAFVLPHTRISPLDGLQSRLGDQTEIRFEPGCDNFVQLPGIRSEYLSSPAGQSNGLLGEYYDNTSLAGEPEVKRHDSKLDFWWFSKGPTGRSQYSVRWTGRLKAPGSGRYTIEVLHTATARLYLDGKLLFEGTAPEQIHYNPMRSSAAVEMAAGQVYDLRMEYIKDTEDEYANIRLRFAFTPLPEQDDRLTRAIEAARTSDMAIVFIGNPEGYETEGMDRPDIELPGGQNELVFRVIEANPNTVVVLNAGAPVSMPWLESVPALVQMYYPGMDGGSAIARVLAGDVNPSGKLTVTYPKRLEDNPAFENCCVRNAREVIYGEGIFVGYRYYEARKVEPLFPFGHGLSYTSFVYSALQAPGVVKTGETVRVSVTVKNTGPVAGKEVVQLYVADRKASVPRPVKELKGFAKVALQPGESQVIELELDERAFSFYDPYRSTWVAEPGEFEILVGSSSADIRLKATTRLE